MHVTEPRVPRPRTLFDGIGGFARALTSFTPDHPEGRALLQAAAGMGVTPWVAGQLADPATDRANGKWWDQWSRQWRAAGAAVFKWWRVSHARQDAFPGAPQVQGIPNPESQAEYDRLPRLLPFAPAAVATLGKAAGLSVDLLASRRVWVLAECFREDAAADHTISNSYAWWEQRRFDMGRWTPSVQLYGQPFASPAEQAEEARTLGCRGVWLYPLDGANPSDINDVAEVMA